MSGERDDRDLDAILACPACGQRTPLRDRPWLICGVCGCSWIPSDEIQRALDWREWTA